MLAAALLVALAAPPDPVRVVCIGDSITQGRKGVGEHKPTRSWRYPLWKKTVDAKWAVDFVGSEKGGFEGDPDWADYQGKPFDREHEGHWGWKTSDIRAKLEGWLKGYMPDVALVQLGSNDPGGKMTTDDSKAELKKIVELLRARNPKVAVLLGTCMHAWAPFPELATKLRALAAELHKPDAPVLVVDLAPGWVSDPKAAGTHTVDWVHPNDAGDEKIAEAWFQALKPIVASKTKK